MPFKNRPPTIADVAQRAAVSIATVSRVLNGTTPVQADKAERVRLAMRELQFAPRHDARRSPDRSPWPAPDRLFAGPGRT